MAFKELDLHLAHAKSAESLDVLFIYKITYPTNFRFHYCSQHFNPHPFYISTKFSVICTQKKKILVIAPTAKPLLQKKNVMHVFVSFKKKNTKQVLLDGLRKKNLLI